MNAKGAGDEMAASTTEKQSPAASRIVRRVHVFLGLFLAPWMFMGSSHSADALPQWLRARLFLERFLGVHGGPGLRGHPALDRLWTPNVVAFAANARLGSH